LHWALKLLASFEAETTLNTFDTLLELSSKNYANAEFTSAVSPRAMALLFKFLQNFCHAFRAQLKTKFL